MNRNAKDGRCKSVSAMVFNKRAQNIFSKLIFSSKKEIVANAGFDQLIG